MKENKHKLLSRFFKIDEIVILKGGKLSNKFPKSFARNIAFKSTKTD